MPVVAATLLKEMRLVGAALGGVYPKAHAWEQLQMPPLAYRHYCCMDFLVIDPPLKINIPKEAIPKEDYHLTASVLTASGVICRLNHYTCGAAHYDVGGAGAERQRAARDKRAASWLLNFWNTSKECVFQRHPLPMKRDRHVRFRNSMALVKRCDSRLEDRHKALEEVLAVTKMTQAQVTETLRNRRAGKKRKLSLASGSKGPGRRAGQKRIWREAKREQRGTSVEGNKRRAGRTPPYGKPRGVRSQLCWAKRALKKIALEHH